MHAMLDIYTDYLICQTKYATSTGLSAMLGGEISHDSITRFLNKNAYGSKDLWMFVKEEVRKHAARGEGVLILDDCIEEKPYTDENEIICWHYSHAKGSHVKGVNILSCLVQYGDISFPVGYELVHKEVEFCDIETKRLRRKSGTTKNEHFRNLIERCVNNKIAFEYALADNWFGAKDNLKYLHHEVKKKFIIGIKSNRTVALSLDDKVNGHFQQVQSLDLKDGDCRKVWLKGTDFPVQLLKKVFINEDGSEGSLYLVSNDIYKEADHLYEIYKKRWAIEEYHKSIKQNASLAKSPTKTVTSQSNHIFASLIAFCKLELMALKHAVNHFAIKYKLIMVANRAAWNELKNLAAFTSGA